MSDSEYKVLAGSVHILEEHRDFLYELRKQLPSNFELIIPFPPTEDEILRRIGDVDIVLASEASRELIESAEKLKMIQTMGTGVDKIDVSVAAERGVIVCNAAGLNAIPVAEHTISLMLTLVKKMINFDKELRIGSWQRTPVTLIHGKTLGIVGLGNIGVEVAKRAKSFGMRIIAIKKHPSEELRVKLGIDFLGGPDSLPRILKESDFVVLSPVLIPETKKMIGEKELRMMKKSAYLVNISRGGVIDESALIRALRKGIIAGAGLDVFEVEPISSNNPLLKLENVVLTPHIAGGAGPEELREERAIFVARNMKKIIKGQKPKNIIDPTLKYAVNESHL